MNFFIIYFHNVLYVMMRECMTWQNLSSNIVKEMKELILIYSPNKEQYPVLLKI